MSIIYRALKRLGDIILSTLAILILSPLLLLTAVVLLLTGEHQVIYRQRRVGRDFRSFDIYKFVTMRSRSELSGTITAKDDPRVLPVGRVLRKAKINEVPQLFNILFGHMSFVGPRPLVESEVAMYPAAVREAIYADNQPGLTGVGSLFFRDEDEMIARTGRPPIDAYRHHIMPVKGAMELWYREYKSPRLDAKVVFLTAWAVSHSRSVPLVAAFRREAGFPAQALDAYERLFAGDQKRDSS